jgi:nucleotide-binding universal stress UspA family protein
MRRGPIGPSPMVKRRDRASREPLRSVLIATDLSRGAQLAVRRAAELPLARNAELTLLRVLADDLPAPAGLAAEQRLNRAASALLERCRARGLRQVEVQSELCSGEAFVEIIRRSRLLSCDLALLGRHGERSLRDAFIGTTAERVVRKGDVPVLVVASRTSAPYRRPLVAVAIDDSALRILEITARVVGPAVKSIPAVHVYQLPFESRLASGDTPLARDHRRHYHDEAAEGLSRLLRSAPRAGTQWEPVLVTGEPRERLLHEASQRKTDLIVLGTHGRSGIARTLLGSVAEHVLRAAACDVLIARPARFAFELP